MNTFFNPRSVVVIGASNSPFNLGATICRGLKTFLSYPGAVYAVNRKGEDVYGCPGYTAVTDIPGEVDLAVVITPAAVVPEFLRQCGLKGVTSIVIESSGFAEIAAVVGDQPALGLAAGEGDLQGLQRAAVADG